MSKVLTKKAIEDLAMKIGTKLEKLEYAGDVRIYYNNKCIDYDSGTLIAIDETGAVIENEAIANLDDDSKVTFTTVYTKEIIPDIDPHNCFEWAAYNHIISMSFEGPLYDYIYYDGDMPKAIEKIIHDAGLYYELGDSWNCTFYPLDSEMEIEYTKYEKPEPAKYIFLGCRENNDYDYPEELDTIMQLWYYLGHHHGDEGGCVIGQKMCFRYKDTNYEMCPMTGWQGENSWTPYVPTIKGLLSELGATNINWDCGRLD